MADKSWVDDVLDTELSNLPKAKELYQELIKSSNIEKVQEEDFVIDSLMRGKNKATILKELKMKHPTISFSEYDLNKFLERNDQIVRELEKRNNVLARRHLNAKVKIEEEIAQLYMMTRKLIDKYDQQGDNTNTIAALRTANDMMVKYAKIAGFYGDNSQSGEKNQNIINIVTDKNAEVSRKIITANFNMVNEHEKNKRNVESKTPDKETNSEGVSGRPSEEEASGSGNEES